jgi:hypothetical protein
MVLAGTAAMALVACSTPHASRAPASNFGTESPDRLGEFSSAGNGHDDDDDGAEEQSYDIVFTAGGRPPPRPPPPQPRPTGRANPRDKERDPARPGHVPGRRLAGPPDAPYWQQVFEIPWRGSVRLQGPKPTPPERAAGEAAKPAPRSPPQQIGQPPTSSSAQATQPSPAAATGATRAAELLRPRGRLIGQAGSSSRIRIVQGGQTEAEAFFNQLVRETGATPISKPGLAGFAELPGGGGTIGFRTTSTSGPPTIDVRIPGLGIREIKFVP